MSAYGQIAARFGVNPVDDEAIDEFYLKILPSMPSAQREGILKELLESVDVTSTGSNVANELPERIPLMSMKLVKPAIRRGGTPIKSAVHGYKSIDDRLNAIIHELIGSGITLEQATEAFEGKYIVAAMQASRGDVTQASRKLGVHRNTLHNKLRSQTMLNGFAEGVRPAKRRVGHKKVSAPTAVSTTRSPIRSKKS